VLPPGTVIHTFGYPEPEIFGFLYVYPGRLASLGIFVPSWLDSPVRTGYRYLQHWLKHPRLWPYVAGGRLRSWGAKSLQEAGRRGEPHLVGNGYARIGEGAGTTNVLTGSGVDEAWASGVHLAEGVIELLRAERPFTRESLAATYVKRHRESWVDRESRIAERSRDGFQRGFVRGLVGMGLAGFTNGKLGLSGDARRPHERVPTLEDFCAGKLSTEELRKIRETGDANGTGLHEAVMEHCGWPPIEFDGQLLVSHQDALLMGGKVQAADGFADHVRFRSTHVCEQCAEKLCIEMCSGQAITAGADGGVPQFDRDKCIHCGACLWSCSKSDEADPERSNVDFRSGSGGLHSAEN
jgi:electron-transferring-flavoprotein dehydrogenase